MAKLGIDIDYIHRNDRTGFKAGALENGLRTAKGEFVAIFDVDFVPEPDFLQKSIHYFYRSASGNGSRTMGASESKLFFSY